MLRETTVVLKPAAETSLPAPPMTAEPAESQLSGREAVPEKQSKIGTNRSLIDDDGARSSSELLLFRTLQATPDLRDVFQLNQSLDFPFGNRAAEGDLVSQDLRLVHEVDGYYHFQSSDAYRRDRRKDLLLQKHGWLVVRVFAEDIPTDTESVLATIRSVVTHQKSQQSRKFIDE